MCGFAGLIQTSGAEVQLSDQVALMLRFLAHRGPDHACVVHDEFCALGHVRLAMMDPQNGDQPCSDLSGRYWLAYNGEVYNYRSLRRELLQFHDDFRTDCDTEVVLKSLITWGKDALSRFNGGFSIAFYDRLEQRLLLARDRYGKRPLFFTQQHLGLAFSSELKAFMALHHFRFEFNPVSLAEVFFSGALIGGETVFKGVYEVQPGTVLEWKSNVFVSQRYISLTVNEPNFSGTYADACEELRQRLGYATLLRHRSDKDLGILLSGGLDSGIVAVETHKQSGSAKRAFSVAFDHAKFDESSMQRQMADYCGYLHASLYADSQAIALALHQAVWHAETPFNCSAPVPMLLLANMVKQSGVSAVLTGEGADEAFLGYDLFKEVRLRSSRDGNRLTQLFDLYQKWGATDLKRVELSVERHDKLEHPFFSHLIRFSNSRLSCRLLRRSMSLNEFGDRWRQSQPTLNGLTPMQRARQIEYRLLLSGYLLSSQGDRMFAAYGVENRSPFLDNDVVDFALSLPEEWCLNATLEEKSILRAAYRTQLPEVVVSRRKQSYLSPDLHLIKSISGEKLIDEYLNARSLANLEWLDADYAQMILERCRKSPITELTSVDSQSVLLMLTTSILHRQFISGEHVPLVPIHHVRIKHMAIDNF
ncbi:asparagine synthase (glutamine-hydrolyzing) [Undibacterium sp. Ji67W]|uniref:asparagine synthase (glutamine-hydrolyzing) n=1 Tax=Undibacterium sp. Ji67W TaxID=3413042 RepID=UPI003BF22AAB